MKSTPFLKSSHSLASMIKTPHSMQRTKRTTSLLSFPIYETPKLSDKIIYLAKTALHYKSYSTGAVEPVESMDYIGTLQPLKVEIGACILSGTKPLSHTQHSK